MIRLGIIISSIFSFVSLFAKEPIYTPLMEEGKVWTVRFEESHGRGDYLSTFIVRNDTLITSERFFIIEENPLDVEKAKGIYFIKEENRQIFLYSRLVDHPIPLLDFNVTEGERTMDILHEWSYYVSGWEVAKDEIGVFQEIPRRYLELAPSNNSRFYWIEGIGSPGCNFLFNYDIPACDPPEEHYHPTVVSCMKDGSVLYLEEDMNLLVSGVRVPVERDITDNSDYYDLHGRPISNPQPGSIYIQNGKKMVWR